MCVCGGSNKCVVDDMKQTRGWLKLNYIKISLNYVLLLEYSSEKTSGCLKHSTGLMRHFESVSDSLLIWLQDRLPCRVYVWTPAALRGCLSSAPPGKTSSYLNVHSLVLHHIVTPWSSAAVCRPPAVRCSSLKLQTDGSTAAWWLNGEQRHLNTPQTLLWSRKLSESLQMGLF